MPTLMTTGTFDELAKILATLNATPEKDGSLAGIFVPWAGSRLIAEGGIYYVGMATRGDYGADHPQTFEACKLIAETLCTIRRDDLARSQFWQFLDGLTWALLGDSFDKTSDRWGWSNLLKIGCRIGNPNRKLIKDQQNVCVSSLHEEFERLRNSLIVIVSAETLGVLDSPHIFPRLVPHWNKDYERNWNKDHEDTGVWSFADPDSGNLYIHVYHPRHAVTKGFWGSELGCTIHLARTMPRFAA